MLLGTLTAWYALFASSHLNAADINALIEQAFAWLADVDQTSRPASAARAFVLYVRGQMALSALKMEVAQEALEESLRLFERIGDPWWSATVLQQLASAAWTRNDLDQTREYFQRSLAVRRGIGDEVGAAGVLINLGALAGFDGGQRVHKPHPITHQALPTPAAQA